MPNHLPALAAATLIAAGTPLPAHANGAADLIRTFYAAVDAKDRDAYGALIAEDFKDHDRPAAAPEGATDAQVILNLFDELAAGFPGAAHALDIVEPLPDDDRGRERAMVRWTFEGTHSGPFFGIPASGNPVSINGIDVFVAEGGRLVEQWHVEELADLFAQIGAR